MVTFSRKYVTIRKERPISKKRRFGMFSSRLSEVSRPCMIGKSSIGI